MRKALGILSAFTALLFAHAPTSAKTQTTFRANLSGSEEVPARATAARGHANFYLEKGGTEIRFRVIVSNIENVTEAHIHLGAKGENGPAVVTLYGPVPAGGGRKSGILATGTITAASLSGPLAGHTIGELIDAMRAGSTYVNVHTNDGTDPGNRGPGDFPDGEIRGQIR